MVKRIGLILSVCLALSLLLALPTVAQEPVVYGLFFYSPSCPHCHIVMDDHWPGIQAEFGDQLQVMFVNVARPEGGQFMAMTTQALGITERGVPMLIIGSELFVGSLDIPQRAPDYIRAGLARGGIDFPAVPGVEAFYEATLARQGSGGDGVAFVPQVASAPASLAEASGPVDRLLADPVANFVAVGVLVALAASLVMMVIDGGRQLTGAKSRLLTGWQSLTAQRFIFVLALVGLGLSVSLVSGSLTTNPLVALLAGAELLLFGGIAVLLVRSTQRPAPWLVPLVLVAGLLTAAYLAYVEVTVSEAVCGAVGDCNVVQQSPYAKLFGIPIGVLGIIGYALIGGVWLSRRVGGWQGGQTLLQLLTLGGVAFSTYLTFLEPFVIGASCAWCLISAVTMLLLLWLVWLTPAEQQPSQQQRRQARFA